MTPFKCGYTMIVAASLLLVTACSAETREMTRENQQNRNAAMAEMPLKACPGSPNCVCSCDTSERHAIAPLAVPAGVEEPISALAGLVQTLPRVDIVEQDDRYLHATFKSRIFRFTDDVEFYYDGSVVHVRSESRLGYSDFGVNRQRIEDIRERFEQDFAED